MLPNGTSYDDSKAGKDTMNDFQPDRDFLKTLRVLYVEDDDETRAQLSLFLRRRVGMLVTASDGVSGLEAFCAQRADMLVTDIQMPGMDGLAMAHEIRRLDRNVPIIVTTAFEQTDYFMRSIDAGVDRYVTKPVDVEKLYEAMLQLGHRLQQEQVTKRISMLLHKSQLQSMASALALAEERERLRIAEGLHDNVVQNLAVAAFRLDAMTQSLAVEATAYDIQVVRDAVGAAIADLRSLSFELSPPFLHEEGLEPALKCLVGEFEHEYGIRTVFSDDGLEKKVGEEQRVTLYRSTQELMKNAIKHAHADCITVSAARSGETLHIRVEDNGRGFDCDTIQERSSIVTGFGLYSIRKRMSILGGAMIVESHPGRGTVITLAVPLKQ